MVIKLNQIIIISKYYYMLSEVFWSFFLTTVSACLLGIIKMLYKSKCKTCECCGIKIERDTAGELHEDELEMQRQQAQL